MDKRMEWMQHAYQVKQRVEGINNWIKANPQVTSPNMYEYTQVFVECGEVFREACEYFNENGYPTVIDKDGKEVEGNHYDLMNMPELKAMRDEINELARLRNLHTSDENSFTSVPCVSDFYSELSYRVICGEYALPKDSKVRAMKKEILCKCMGISFYIWETKQKEPNYVYDNKDEFETVQAMYDSYTKSSDATVHYVDQNGGSAVYPQFGKQIEEVFAYINKNYIYAEEDTNAKTR